MAFKTALKGTKRDGVGPEAAAGSQGPTGPKRGASAVEGPSSAGAVSSYIPLLKNKSKRRKSVLKNRIWGRWYRVSYEK